MPRSPALAAPIAAALALAANSAGAGEAGKQCSMAPINGCNLGYYCRIAPPVGPATLGQCVKKPGSCPDLRQPVCGVNRQTYTNACEAARDGENVEHAGPCPTAPP